MQSSPNEDQAQPTQFDHAPVVHDLHARDRVTYVGDTYVAYRGAGAEVLAVRGDDVVLKFDGAQSPVTLPASDVVKADEHSVDPNAIVDSKHPRVRFIANTSGGLHIIPDLVSQSSESGIALQAGEKIDLLQYFSSEQINRSQGLRRAMTSVSPNNNLPFISTLTSLDDPLPEGSIVTPLVDRYPPGTTIEAPSNEYDLKITKSYQEEDDRNEKMRRRHTTVHGRASRTLGSH